MKILFFIVFLSINTQDNALPEDIPFDGEYHEVVKRNYSYDLGEHCPEVPNEEAIVCESNYKLSKYVSEMFNKDKIPVDYAGKIVDLVRCTTEHMPDVEVSLEIYCHTEGLKEKLVETFSAAGKGENGSVDA